MRVLVLEEGQIFAWMVRHLGPSDVEVLRAASFTDACRLLEADPPDAVVVGLTNARVVWPVLQRLCGEDGRRVPVLHASVEDSPSGDSRTGSGEAWASVLSLPATAEEIERAFETLFSAAMSGAAQRV